MIEFGSIPVFVAVVDSNGFSQAARKLGVSKSAVSKRITQLESRLGVRLLHRSTRRLYLTEAGERYYEYAVKALAAAQEAEDAVTQLQGKPQGLLRISVPMSFGRLHVAPLIPEFLTRYPAIEIKIVMGDKVVDMVEGRFDLAITTGDLPNSTIIARKLAPCHSVVCASSKYIEKHGKPNSPPELIDHNCILYSYSDNSNEWIFLKHDETTKIQVKGNYSVNNGEAVLEALLGDMGIGRLPMFIVGQEILCGRLVRLFDTYTMPYKTLHAVFPERKYLPQKVRVFVDFVIERLCSDEPYWDKLSS